jgi:hypothetical protein
MDARLPVALFEARPESLGAKFAYGKLTVWLGGIFLPWAALAALGRLAWAVLG